jgi:hypothetical protein
MAERGSGSGVSLSMGVLGTLDDWQKRLWRWASLSIGAPLGNLEGGSSTRDFERWMKEALGMEHFSLKRLNAKGPWGGLPYWGPWKIC